MVFVAACSRDRGFRLRLLGGRGVHDMSRWKTVCAVITWGMTLSIVSVQTQNIGLTAIDGIKVGHHTLIERPTGCTVILTEAGAVAAVDVRGSSPGTREIALLDPTNTVQKVHAIVLSGGSAFGLAAADGVVRYLAEREIGYPTSAANVPIVPAAILYDLGIGDNPSIYPTADCGYNAASAASSDPVIEGSVGAGTGATVGKIGGPSRAMKGGVGTAVLKLPNGIQVAALMAVNAVGNVVDPETGSIIAGVRTANGKLADARTIFQHVPDASIRNAENTTIGVVATDAALNRAQLALVARMAHDGLARAIRPAHTPADGDAIFVLSTGNVTADVNLFAIGTLAADVTAEAIVRAVRSATSLPGYPSARDLLGGVR